MFLFFTNAVYPQRISREQYISRYKEIAIRQMNLYGIPASIIMAQACLESNNGNSELAKKANNHFGIKCNNGWTGEGYLYDDDEKNECFRRYGSAEDSFKDHSEFLKNGKRYAFLFSYSKTDYVSWARGLKQAGYATNPKYAELLIKIIDDNNLHRLDLNDNHAHSSNHYSVSNTSDNTSYSTAKASYNTSKALTKIEKRELKRQFKEQKRQERLKRKMQRKAVNKGRNSIY